MGMSSLLMNADEIVAVAEPTGIYEPQAAPSTNDIIITTNEGLMYMPSPSVLDKSIPSHGLPPVPRSEVHLCCSVLYCSVRPLWISEPCLLLKMTEFDNIDMQDL